MAGRTSDDPTTPNECNDIEGHLFCIAGHVDRALVNLDFRPIVERKDAVASGGKAGENRLRRIDFDLLAWFV